MNKTKKVHKYIKFVHKNTKIFFETKNIFVLK